MQRILTTSLLVLLVLAFASQVQAQVRVQCWRCSSFDTYGHYKCYSHLTPVEWDAEAWSDSSSCPPYQTQCPQCSTWTDAEYCWDPDCTKALPFWTVWP
jgi:hypothetical protein